VTNLDDVSDLTKIDSLGMFDLAAGFPEQLAKAAEVAAKIDPPSPESIENIFILGMGGSGIVGNIVEALMAGRCGLPIVVVKDYRSPGCLGEHSLVIAVSYSGNTEETIEATTHAIEGSSKVVVISSGGYLRELAVEKGLSYVPVPSGIQPRAALASMVVPVFSMMEKMGIWGGFEHELAATVAQLQARRPSLVPEAPIEENPAKKLALDISRKIPLIYGSGIGAVAAQRFKCQINENAKAPAFWNAYPELDHNELAGWGQHGDVTRQIIHLVELRNDFEHPQVRKRFDLTRDLMRECIAGVSEVHARGDHPLGQLFDLIYVCDYASLYLAVAEGIDPGPVTAIEELKRRL
jgi:glucose/mannose-6-phosphate isomerase